MAISIADGEGRLPRTYDAALPPHANQLFAPQHDTPLLEGWQAAYDDETCFLRSMSI